MRPPGKEERLVRSWQFPTSWGSLGVRVSSPPRPSRERRNTLGRTSSCAACATLRPFSLAALWLPAGLWAAGMPADGGRTSGPGWEKGALAHSALAALRLPCRGWELIREMCFPWCLPRKDTKRVFVNLEQSSVVSQKIFEVSW